MAEIKIHILHTGLVQVDKALPFHEKFRNPLAFTGLFRSNKNQIVLPVSSYLIEHPKGLVLIDTGWNELVRTSQWQELGLQTVINKAYLPDGWSIRERLAELGYKPADIDYLVLSHLHSDHVSGLPLVKDAKNILVSAEEWQAGNTDKLRYIPKSWANTKMRTFNFHPSNLGPFHRSFDLFNDGSINFIYTPGHSRGLAATLIKGADDKEVLLASDTAYAQESIDKLYTPGIAVNRAQAIESVGWVKEKSQESQVIETITNHDPNVKQHMITL
ncbi:N-acyl homoserine lactonase family protein [Companilactobacillus jidongensis]|uniref:N-acyl homoserine lactonase family protein n=1 Tax=Companilactobacillus jidongensis TaxID=2486006 RepID=UPI000F78400D|nr:N-acyl homoserine lactonase family protein [Companilactobacillus jidongensis]